MKYTCRSILLFLVFISGIIQTNNAKADLVNGQLHGHYGTLNQGHSEVTGNFLLWYGMTSNYATYPLYWGSENLVDDPDFVFFAGHGAHYNVDTVGAWVDLTTKEYGDSVNDGHLDFIAFESCCVVPSERDVDDPIVSWLTTLGGLHQILGFRNPSSQATDQNISYIFGFLTVLGLPIIDAWLLAIEYYGDGTELGSVVYYIPSRNETAYNVGPDSPRNAPVVSYDMLYHRVQ